MTENFPDKQARILSYIQQSRTLLESIYNAHISEKFSLLYPRNGSISSDGKHSRGQSAMRTIKTGDLKLLALPDEFSIREGEVDETTLARMMGNRLGECISYLERLHGRVGDKCSKVLVTGDVNSGKSTFVNALLQKELLPTDQQPCTQCFCEVVPVRNAFSRDEFCVHAMSDYSIYNSENPRTYDKLTVSKMQECIQDEGSTYQLFRVFLEDDVNAFAQCSQIEVSLIDSPGLNSDLFKTMALFSKQEDIDVIVFLINAANHLTLSAREFLETASHEKAYVFVVVNKFDDIKNQDKCKRIVLAQIQEVLPKTYEERSELIHFISAGQYFKQVNSNNTVPISPMSASSVETRDIMDPFRIHEDFKSVEKCLRNFILEKRTKSKLLPAQTYLQLLLNEMSSVLDNNKKRRFEDLNRLQHELDIIAPCFEELMAHHGIIQADLRRTLDEICQNLYDHIKLHLTKFEKIQSVVSESKWNGLIYIWQFNDSVRSRLYQEAMLWMQDARQLAIANTYEGIHLLNGVATAHARQVFNLVSNEDVLCESAFPSYESLVDPIPEVAVLDLIDVSLFLRGSTWLSAATIAGATFGYQHLFSLALRIFDLSRSAGKVVTISLVVVAGGAAFLALLGDLESIVRSRLVSHYSQVISSDLWVANPARLLETHARAKLTEHQLSLVARFESALHQQRQLRAEKDLLRCQIETTVSYLEQQLRGTQNLLNAIRQYSL